ncbi:MAG: diguanylate cyclase [Nitrospirae bacterium]|nr:diguanylate cyclase [Nitrospirota bacterium]
MRRLQCDLRQPVLLVLAILAAGIFAVDLQLPLGIAAPIPYIILMAAGMWLPHRCHVLTLAAGCTALTILGFVLSPAGHREAAIVNRSLSVGAIWAVTILALARLRTEREFVRLHHQYDLILDGAGDGIYGLDKKGCLTFVNQAAARLLGYPAEELLGRSMHATIHHSQPDGRSYREEECPIYAAIRDGVIRRVADEVFWRKDGASVPVEYVSAPLRERGNGAILGAIVVFHDLTERRRAETNRRLAATVVDNSLDGMMVTDAHTTILYVNRAFCAVTGYASEEALGKTPRILQSGRQDRSFYHQLWAQLAATGQWQGEIWNRRKNGELYVEWLRIRSITDDRGTVQYYIGVFSELSNIKLAADRFEYMAHHDALTGLPNRLAFQERLHQALALASRSKTLVAALFLDLDRFKPINDTHGHQVGDLVLKTVAGRIRNCLRESDVVARLGGDEFVLFLAGLASRQDVGQVADKLLESLASPMTLAGHTLRLTASIGIAMYPLDGQDGDTLLRIADAAMYQAKERRTGYQFYAAEGDGGL